MAIELWQWLLPSALIQIYSERGQKDKESVNFSKEIYVKKFNIAYKKSDEDKASVTVEKKHHSHHWQKKRNFPEEKTPCIKSSNSEITA